MATDRYGKELNFFVRLETADGCLVQNRQTDNKFYWNDIYKRWNKDFIDITLKRDCCEKGVELVSYTVDDKGIKAIVKWL